MVNAQNLPARIVASVLIWSLLLYGLFSMGAFWKYVMWSIMTFLMLGKPVVSHYIASL